MKHQVLRLALIPAALLASIMAVAAPSAAQSGSGCQGPPGGGRVRLSVLATDLRNAHGEMVFTVYPDDWSRFLVKGGKLLRARVAAHAPATETCFWVAPGRYAVATYHDENGDHNFNRTLFSIKEGFGFSNDAPTTLGLPKFERVRFAVSPTGTAIRIRTRYSR